MKKIKAFSLLEITINLGIIGITLTGIITLWFALSKYQKEKINNQKYEYIRISMQNFLIQHGRLPNASKDTSGLEDCFNTNGNLPYKTLGISKKYMFDANGNAFRYIVNDHFTNTNIPLVTPLSCPPKNADTSFLRIYTYNDNKINLYDLIAHTNEKIKLIKNGTSVISEKDFFYILPPIKKFIDLNEMYKWIESSKVQDPKYKTSNTIAWILISFNKNNPDKQNQTNTKIFYENGDTIFYQSRFDMAAQTGFNATPEPIYIE